MKYDDTKVPLQKMKDAYNNYKFAKKSVKKKRLFLPFKKN